MHRFGRLGPEILRIVQPASIDGVIAICHGGPPNLMKGSFLQDGLLIEPIPTRRSAQAASGADRRNFQFLGLCQNQRMENVDRRSWGSERARRWMLPLCCVGHLGDFWKPATPGSIPSVLPDKTVASSIMGRPGAAAICWPGWWLVTCQTASRKSAGRRSEYARRGWSDCGKLYLQRGQARWARRWSDRWRLYQAQLLGKPEIKFDWVKFGWIGTDQPNVTSLLFEAIPVITVWMTSRRCGSPWYAPTAPPDRQTMRSSGFLRRCSGQSSSRCWVTKVREP